MYKVFGAVALTFLAGCSSYSPGGGGYGGPSEPENGGGDDAGTGSSGNSGESGNNGGSANNGGSGNSERQDRDTEYRICERRI